MEPTLTTQDVSDHPLAIALRTVFWQLEHIYADTDDLDKGQILYAVRQARDEVNKVLTTTPTTATPIISQVLPSLNAACTLIGEGEVSEAEDLLFDLRQRFIPSPARGGDH
jgi:hypothetical protein